MATRVLVLGAGSGPGNNLVRSLIKGDPSLEIVGCHTDRFALKKSIAPENFPLPLAEHAFVRDLNRVAGAQRIDLVIPNSQPDVEKLSSLRDRLECRHFLPRREVIELCRDKYRLTEFLSQRGFPVPATYPVTNVRDVGGAFRRLRPAVQVWCRMREGTGSAAAIPVTSAAQARWWIGYWEKMRRIPPGSFTLSEYLPGRDFTVQCLLKDGGRIMAKMYQRLEYHVVGGGPSGVSSSAALAKMVFDPAVLRQATDAVLALDPRASSVFFVDFKEDASGRACITEINAGRFANVPTIHDLTGRDNMAIAYVRAALGEPVETREPQPYADDCYVLRGIDTVPAIVRGSELFQDSEWK